MRIYTFYYIFLFLYLLRHTLPLRKPPIIVKNKWRFTHLCHKANSPVNLLFATNHKLGKFVWSYISAFYIVSNFYFPSSWKFQIDHILVSITKFLISALPFWLLPNLCWSHIAWRWYQHKHMSENMWKYTQNMLAIRQ